MNIIYIGHAMCKLLAQIRCCSNEEEVRADLITECIWCICRIIVDKAVFSVEDIESIRVYMFYHTVHEIADTKVYNVLSLLYDLCCALSISEEQGITALHCAYDNAITDKAEVLADNIYKLYVTNNKE